MKSKYAAFLFTLLAASLSLRAQDLQYYEQSQEFYKLDQDSTYLFELREAYGQAKVYPRDMELPILIALAHYPELKDVRIHFLKGTQAVAHSAMPMNGTLFGKRKNRVYLINISTSVRPGLEATQFQNLSYNAQIGVMAHELAHISWYEERNTLELIGAGIAYWFKAFRISMERDTDLRTMERGLPHQLKAWSLQVHETHINDGRGDLYWSPEEIDQFIRGNAE